MCAVVRIGAQGKARMAHQVVLPEADALDVRIVLIQDLIPLGLQAVAEVLQQEVQALAGQKLSLPVPRVCNRQAGIGVPLHSYTRLQQPRAAGEGVLRRILYGLSCRDYRTAAEAVVEAFGLSRSSISRRYIRATARKPHLAPGAAAQRGCRPESGGRAGGNAYAPSPGAGRSSGHELGHYEWTGVHPGAGRAAGGQSRPVGHQRPEAAVAGDHAVGARTSPAAAARVSGVATVAHRSEERCRAGEGGEGSVMSSGGCSQKTNYPWDTLQR